MKAISRRALLIALTALTLAAQSDGERQLETAVYRETVMGDVPAAIGMYRAILSQKGIARPVAARALWQLGQCQEKLGQRREAHATYARVVREYASESGIAAQARGKLAGWSDALPGPRNLRFEEGDPGKTPPGWFVPQVEKVSGSLAELRRKGCRRQRRLRRGDRARHRDRARFGRQPDAELPRRGLPR